MAMTVSRGIVAFVAVGAAAMFGLGAATGAEKPAAIQDGGTLTVGMVGNSPGTLDPDFSANPELDRAFCESLYDVAKDGSTVPLLASGPPVYSKDKLTVTIPLRKGILFNDGTPFNAQAAVATFERDLNTPGGGRANILGNPTGATANGPYAVTLHYTTPDTALVGGMTNERMQSPAQIAKLGSNFGSDPVCVGPFMFQSEVPGQTLTLVRSPYYYDKQDVHLDKLVFQYEPSDIAAASALESGDVQALDSVPYDVLKSVKDNGFRVIGSLGLGTWDIGVNIGNANGDLQPIATPNTPIGSSPLLRQAFEMAIDRRTLNRVVFGGLNIPGCTPITPAAGPWFDHSFPCTPYDPAQARKLVQQAGFSNPTVQLSYPSSSLQYQVVAEFLQSEEAAAGINLTLDPQDGGSLGSRIASGSYQMYLGQKFPVKADPDWMRTALPTFWWGFSSKQYDIDMTNGRLALSQEARQTDYDAAEKVLLGSRAVMYLEDILNRAACSSKLTGVQIYPDAQIRVEFAAYKAGS
jgi:peptide/nickel transport system substrate-binding protein